MRNRHFPRVCLSCQAPMARQEATCWHCGTEWAAEDAPQRALRVVPGEAPTHLAVASPPRIAATVAGDARAATVARLDEDRWTDEGGSVESEALGLRAVAAGRR
jgi:hypothetical protein